MHVHATAPKEERTSPTSSSMIARLHEWSSGDIELAQASVGRGRWHSTGTHVYATHFSQACVNTNQLLFSSSSAAQSLERVNQIRTMAASRRRSTTCADGGIFGSPRLPPQTSYTFVVNFLHCLSAQSSACSLSTRSPLACQKEFSQCDRVGS